MPRFANIDHIKQVGELKEQGFTYQEIADEMTKRTGKTFGYKRNKAIRYKKLYDKKFGDK